MCSEIQTSVLSIHSVLNKSILSKAVWSHPKSYKWQRDSDPLPTYQMILSERAHHLQRIPSDRLTGAAAGEGPHSSVPELCA